MSGSLSVQPDRLRSYSQQHGEVADAVSRVTAGTPPASTVWTSYGNIGHPMSGSLGDLLDARSGALDSALARAERLADGLRRAAGLYEQSDEDGASAVGSAADATTQPGVRTLAGDTLTGNSPDTTGQMLSALGQQAGQVAGQVGQTVGQAVGQAVAGLAQIPGVVAQAVQQIVETAMSAAESTADTDADTELEDEDERDDPTDGEDEADGDGEDAEQDDRAGESRGGEPPSDEPTPPADDAPREPQAEPPAPPKAAPTRPADAESPVVRDMGAGVT